MKDTKEDLLRSRERNAVGALDALAKLDRLEREHELDEEMEAIQASVMARQKPFRSHPLLNSWMLQYSEDVTGKVGRFKFLVLVGPSVQGKTSKAMSLFPGRTLKVCCGSCPPGILPSVADFRRGLHKAIVFDEVRMDQVLRHREFFQANSYKQSLGHSATNMFTYSVFIYQVALILCTNEWNMSSTEFLPSDLEWIGANQVLVTLPSHQRWYLDD